jgi:thymidylate synthase (FAD)
MKIIEQQWQYINKPIYEELLRKIEYAGRTCYGSLISEETRENFIKKRIEQGHESIIEHGSITVEIQTDRGVSHELVRHRIASYSQSSTRYIKYKGDIEFVLPVWFRNIEERSWNDSALLQYNIWQNACIESEKAYHDSLGLCMRAEQARTVLNHSVSTNIIVTANLREWRHILKERTPKWVHPQMRDIMCSILNSFIVDFPVFFNDIKIDS